MPWFRPRSCTRLLSMARAACRRGVAREGRCDCWLQLRRTRSSSTGHAMASGLSEVNRLQIMIAASNLQPGVAQRLARDADRVLAPAMDEYALWELFRIPEFEQAGRTATQLALPLLCALIATADARWVWQRAVAGLPAIRHVGRAEAISTVGCHAAPAVGRHAVATRSAPSTSLRPQPPGARGTPGREPAAEPRTPPQVRPLVATATPTKVARLTCR